MDTTQYLEDHGVLDDLSEESAKAFFLELMENFKSQEVDAKLVSDVLKELLHQHLYDAEVKIEESALLTAMEMATELDEVDPDTEDFNLIMDPIEEYLKSQK